LVPEFFEEIQEMVKSIYVGNLPFSASDEEIREMFSPYGEVQSVKLISDRDTGRFRGFGFVEMNDAEAQKAIEGLNGTDMGGRNLRVNLAEEKPQRPKRSW
jgi:RNA recognition motif-containing protein